MVKRCKTTFMACGVFQSCVRDGLPASNLAQRAHEIWSYVHLACMHILGSLQCTVSFLSDLFFSFLFFFLFPILLAAGSTLYHLLWTFSHACLRKQISISQEWWELISVLYILYSFMFCLVCRRKEKWNYV